MQHDAAHQKDKIRRTSQVYPPLRKQAGAQRGAENIAHEPT